MRFKLIKMLERAIMACIGLLAIVYGVVSLQYLHNPMQPSFTNHKQVKVLYTKMWAASGEDSKYVPLIINSSKVVNAYSNIDKITLTQGMLDDLQTEDELAYIIGHEISHVVLGHLSVAPSFESGSVDALAANEAQEAQADKYSAFLVIKIGKNICIAREYRRRRLSNGDHLLGEHPSNAYRYNQLNVNCGSF